MQKVEVNNFMIEGSKEIYVVIPNKCPEKKESPLCIVYSGLYGEKEYYKCEFCGDQMDMDGEYGNDTCKFNECHSEK